MAVFDSYAREIDYLRVSVTDRCNLRCKYCMPEEGVDNLGHPGILSLEEIVHLIRVSVRTGVRKIRLTGGEPLVRKNFTELLRQVGAIPEIQDIGITTNGILFADMAEELKAAGLTRVNFSLDSMKEERFHEITRRGDMNSVIRSIEKALSLDLAPIKINTVVMKGINDDEILSFVELAKRLPLHVRFIEFMPIGDLPFYQTDRMVPTADVQALIEEKYALHRGTVVPGNGPAQCYQIEGGKGSVGFISAMSNHFCAACNRIRMTADGKLRSCLFGKQEVNLKLALQNGASDEKLAALFRKAIREKPNRHHMDEGWGSDNERKMYQIGG